ncbi:MAG: hypothetical protein C5B49_12925 [Bdellovibrio sp.]|nr:MAG: hypothetical protein C5B49_12925 [Bdellovibrio sp.]
MAVVFSKHAVEKMFQRNVSADEVEMILDDPDGVFPQSRDKSAFYKSLSGHSDNAIAVVAVKQIENFEVITVMHNFEVKK